MGLIGLIGLVRPINPIYDIPGKKKKVAPGNERASNFIIPSILLEKSPERRLSRMGLMSLMRLISPILDRRKRCEVWNLL
jgi:hypothetical protein